MERSSKVHDKRSVRLEKVLGADYIPFMTGRPVREKVIGQEDLLNLRIALNTARTLEEFVKMV
jgi:hypothetical protein